MSAMKIQFGKNKKEKTIIAVLVAIIIAAVYFYIALRPAIANLSALLPKVSTLNKDLADARFLISKKGIIEKQKKRLQLEMDKYREIFPSQKEIPQLLENLSLIAGEANVKIIGIKPLGKRDAEAKEKERIYQEIPIEIIAKSGYHQLGRFLQELETGNRFIMLKDIEIGADPNSIKRHDVLLIASTYILVKE